ncbi:hypothetical protein AB5I41_26930 [Sphingomonas sp. MMS24-JH45]
MVGRAPLFRLIEVDDAADLFRRCAARAILTRPFAGLSRRLRSRVARGRRGAGAVGHRAGGMMTDTP